MVYLIHRSPRGAAVEPGVGAIQYAAAVGSRTEPYSGGTDITLTVAAAVPKGQTVVVWVFLGATGGLPSLSDTRGNAWEILQDYAAHATARVLLARAYVTTALEVGDQILFTDPYAWTDKRGMTAAAFTGVRQTNPRDGLATASAAGTTSVTGALPPTSYGDELLLSAAGQHLTSGSGGGSVSAGWTLQSSFALGSAVDALNSHAAWQIVTSTGAYSATHTSPDSGDWSQGMAGLRGDGVAPQLDFSRADNSIYAVR